MQLAFLKRDLPVMTADSGPCSELGPVLWVLLIVIELPSLYKVNHLILTASPGGRCSHHPHFTD